MMSMRMKAKRISTMVIRGPYFMDNQTDSLASVAQLLNILAPNGLRHVLRYHGWGGGPLSADDSEEEDYGGFGYRKWRSRHQHTEPPKVPSDAGTELMGTGDFGDNSYYVDERKQRKKMLAQRLMWRELGVDPIGVQRRATKSMSQVSLCRPLTGIILMMVIGLDPWVTCGQNYPL